MIMKRESFLTIAFIKAVLIAQAQPTAKLPPHGFDSVRIEISHGKIDTITYTSKTVGANLFAAANGDADLSPTVYHVPNF